jgi:RNA polymerase sigma-70 factor (ECF subfamily)
MRPELTQAADLLRLNTPEAVEEAIGLLQSTVYSFSMKVCGHTEDAEDTTQEVLFSSLEHLARIQDSQALAVWLYTVTRNRCWKMRRKPAHAPKHILSLEELLQDAAENPEGNLLSAERHHLIHQAVLRIPVQLRIVLVLHDMEELTTEQVAQILSLQPGTIRVRLHRARLSVRKEMNTLIDSVPDEAPNRSLVSNEPRSRRAKAKPRPSDCRALFSNLSEYLDGRVEPISCEAMRKHIEACPACIAFVQRLREAIDRCRSLEIPCDPFVALRLRSILTKEYLRLLEAV